MDDLHNGKSLSVEKSRVIAMSVAKEDGHSLVGKSLLEAVDAPSKVGSWLKNKCLQHVLHIWQLFLL